MYALNQALIANPTIVDRDTIVGTLQGSGAEFKFRRHVVWKLNLEISVNGVRLHDSAGEYERQCFEQLRERALQYGSDTADIARVTAKKIASEFFGR